LIGAVFPVAAGLLYLLVSKQFFAARTWKRLRPISGFFIALLVAAPWHILATLRNPPYFSLSLHSGPGEYHGFLWFYFINEQVLRFLNLRYPRDYNTVPRLWFWLLHFLWLFPWSVYFPAIARLSFKPIDRAGGTRLLAICWTGFILVFFTFPRRRSITRCPAIPRWLCCWAQRWLRAVIGSAVELAFFPWLPAARGSPASPFFFWCEMFRAWGHLFRAEPSSRCLYPVPGHMMDLTFDSFAYLRLPLAVAAIALLGGALVMSRSVDLRSFLATALMMLVFFHAARLAMVVFDPFLSSRPLAEVLLKSSEGS